MNSSLSAAPQYRNAINAIAGVLLDSEKSNVGVSPLSAWLALAVLAAGSGGATAAQLDDLLGADGEDLAVLRAEVEAILHSIPGVTAATAIWSRVQLHSEFCESFPSVEFESTVEQERLDAWVKNATNGLIDKFPIKIDDDVMLALADALAIRGKWVDPFRPENTRPGTFTKADGSQLQVEFMNRTFTGATVVRRDNVWVWTHESYAEPDARRSCNVRFAIGDVGVSRNEAIAAVLESPRTERAHEFSMVRVRLPKFELSSKVNLKHVLLTRFASLSLTDDADFSGISAMPLKIDEAVQRSEIRVEEAGFEAAAVTAITMERAGGLPPKEEPLHLDFDRPFAFSIVDRATNLPLFAGWIADPSAS